MGLAVPEWKTVLLSEVADLNRGVSYSGPGLNKPGPLLVGMGQVDPADGLNLADARTYGGKIQPQHYLTDQDVAVVMTDLTQEGALLGSPAMVPKTPVGELVISHHLHRVRCRSAFNPRFANYLFRGPRWKSFVDGMATGTTVRAVSQEDAGRFKFSLPPLTTQSAIVEVLATLDEKIAHNRKQVLTVSSMIPLAFSVLVKGSDLKLLPSIATVSKGVSYRSSELQLSDIAMMTLKSFDRGGGYKPDGLKPFIGRYKDDQVLSPGDIVVAQTDLTQDAEVVGRVVVVPRQSQFTKLVASLDLIVIRPIDPLDHWFLYGALVQDDFRQHCRSWTSGTTVLHLSSDAIPRYEVPWADATIRGKVAAEIESLVHLMQSREVESAHLRAIRDALLPELLSGRLRVREVERFVEAAT